MAPDNRIAVCPGTYDPITLGHVDVITRAAAMFDVLIVGVVDASVRKSKPLFSGDERERGSLEDATGHLSNVKIELFKNLVVDFARERGAKAIVKGLRAISDFEYELEMNQLKPPARVRHRVDLPHGQYPQYSFLSSSGVKEIATFGGDVSELVPEGVARRCRKRSPADESRSAMDVLVLIAKLDDLVHSAKGVPMTDQVRVDKEEIYDILDQMRATIPRRSSSPLDRQGASGDARRGQA